jgi:RND superfamily putative drug exporter
MSLFLVPAFSALMGAKAWWPGHKGVAARHPGAGERPVGEQDLDVVGAAAR